LSENAVKHLLIAFSVIVLGSFPTCAEKITVTPRGNGGGGGGGTICANGNLLLVYSDSCQLMSQMVGN
jgi:hypothetical protein